MQMLDELNRLYHESRKAGKRFFDNPYSHELWLSALAAQKPYQAAIEKGFRLTPEERIRVFCAHQLEVYRSENNEKVAAPES